MICRRIVTNSLVWVGQGQGLYAIVRRRKRPRLSLRAAAAALGVLSAEGPPNAEIHNGTVMPASLPAGNLAGNVLQNARDQRFEAVFFKWRRNLS
jgi:hypothetical protein